MVADHSSLSPNHWYQDGVLPRGDFKVACGVSLQVLPTPSPGAAVTAMEEDKVTCPECLAFLATQRALAAFDASRIAPYLYQGSFPEPFRDHVRRAGFDMLVLCAGELQPPAAAYAGVHVVRCPFDDGQLSQQEWDRAVRASKEVAAAVAGGKRVLVTCAAGRNRSGLVVALALHRLTQASSKRIVREIQTRRENALTNKNFVDALLQLRHSPREK